LRKKIYIAGCGGMLGDAFYKRFINGYDLRCTDKDVNESWLSYLDFKDYEAYRNDVMAFNPDFLFHLGAYTDLEYCKENPDETYINNTMAVENAVVIANELDIPILYISSAGIFDGKKSLYDDWDIPNPLDVYARSKYEGERFVIDHAKKYYVCRAGWMMGGGRKDKKFVRKIMDQIKEGKKELVVVDDKGGTVTYTHDFAMNVERLINSGFYGLYNMVCTGTTTRVEIAQEILNILHLEKKIKIKKVASDYFKDYIAVRPAFENLINKKLELREMNLMRHWRIALREYIKSIE
jgi:dTDP-4-dehydrorhamnose reductase